MDALLTCLHIKPPQKAWCETGTDPLNLQQNSVCKWEKCLWEFRDLSSCWHTGWTGQTLLRIFYRNAGNITKSIFVFDWTENTGVQTAGLWHLKVEMPTVDAAGDVKKKNENNTRRANCPRPLVLPRVCVCVLFFSRALLPTWWGWLVVKALGW